MEITEKILSTLKKEIDEYEDELYTDVGLLNKEQEIDLLMELSYIDGKRDMLIFLKGVLEDNPNEIAILNEHLKEN